MPLRWVLEGIAEFILERIFDLGADLLTEKLFTRANHHASIKANRARRTSLRRKITGYAPDEVDEQAEILEKPEMVSIGRPDTIRQPNIIKLKVMLGRDGKIKYVQPIKGLHNKQTRLAVAAIKKIRFRPARKSGFPVTQWLELDYQIEK